MIDLNIWIYALSSAFITGLVSLVGVFFLSVNKTFLKKIIFVLVALSVGALFGDVLIHIIPALFEEVSHGHGDGGHPLDIPVYIFAGFLVFFILEKFLRWKHTHGMAEEDCDDCTVEEENVSHIGHLNIFSDAIHNLIDGFLIGASYLVSIEVGVATTLAVFLHEIPQEIGDFGLLIHAGYSRGKALFFNALSAAISIIGVVLALIIGSGFENFTNIALAFTAGGFIYIAGSDLVPELHKVTEVQKTFIQFLGVVLGFLLMLLLVFLE